MNRLDPTNFSPISSDANQEQVQKSGNLNGRSVRTSTPKFEKAKQFFTKIFNTGATFLNKIKHKITKHAKNGDTSTNNEKTVSCSVRIESNEQIQKQLHPLSGSQPSPNTQRLEETKSIKEEALNEVQQDGNYLKYLSSELRKDVDIVKAAATKTPSSLQHADESIKNDAKIMKDLLSKNGSLLKYASSASQDNSDIVKQAVTQNGVALQYASSALRDNSDIVKQAVTQNGVALQYASTELQNNSDIVKQAVTQNGVALRYASERLKKDLVAVGTAVKNNIEAIEHSLLSIDNKDEKESLKSIFTQYPKALKYAGYSIQNDKEIVKAAIQKDPEAIEYSYELINDAEFVKGVLDTQPSVLRYCPRLNSDSNFVKDALKINPDVLLYADQSLQQNDTLISERNRLLSSSSR